MSLNLSMKAEIHPKYYPEAKTTCACGNVIHAGSTIEKQHTEVCSSCHPFYTGKMKYVDTAGRVEKFKERMQRAKKKTAKPAEEDTEKAK